MPFKLMMNVSVTVLYAVQAASQFCLFFKNCAKYVEFTRNAVPVPPYITSPGPV
jgi:hypothetical protein